MPVSVKGKIVAWAREFQHIQYANTVREAYLKPVRIFDIITDIKEYAAMELGAEEVVGISDSYGFNTSASVSPIQVPMVKIAATARVAWEKSRPFISIGIPWPNYTLIWVTIKAFPMEWTLIF